MAAEPKESRLVQQSQGSKKLEVTGVGVPSPYIQQKVTIEQARDGSWVDNIDDWGAFWEEDNYMVFDEGEELDDTYDALNNKSIHISYCFTGCLLFAFTANTVHRQR